MILTAHQPVYLPWLGLIHKIALSECYCIFDIAQYQTKDYNNRNKIKTHQGEIWLTAPVESKNHYETKLKDARLVNNGWNRKHFKSIQMAYQKAPFVKDHIDELESILVGKSFDLLADLNEALLRYLLKAFEINVPIVKASDYDFQGTKSDLVLDMCVKLGASDYIFGAQGRNYADVASFAAKNVTAYFQDYIHPTYKQINGPFLPYMTAFDLLFNEGPRSKTILFEGNAKTIAEMPKSDLNHSIRL